MPRNLATTLLSRRDVVTCNQASATGSVWIRRALRVSNVRAGDRVSAIDQYAGAYRLVVVWLALKPGAGPEGDERLPSTRPSRCGLVLGIPPHYVQLLRQVRGGDPPPVDRGQVAVT
jgi:hypothetical protein